MTHMMNWKRAIEIVRTESAHLAEFGIGVTCSVRSGNLEVIVRRGEHVEGFAVTPAHWRVYEDRFQTSTAMVTNLRSCVESIQRAGGNCERSPFEVYGASITEAMPAVKKWRERMSEIVRKAMDKLDESRMWTLPGKQTVSYAVDPAAFAPVMRVGLDLSDFDFDDAATHALQLMPKRRHGIIVRNDTLDGTGVERGPAGQAAAG
jgi:hypothetical protein